jgi:hypothetical protein
MLVAAGYWHSFTSWHAWHWTGWTALVAIGTLALALATAVLVLFTWRAARAAAKAVQLEAYIDLQREYRSKEMRLARAALYQLPRCDRSKGLAQIHDPDLREKFERVAHYLDNVGTLYSVGLLGIRPAAAFFGGSAKNMWRQLGPYIYSEREVKNSPTYQFHFENLAAALRDMDVDGPILALNTWPPTDADFAVDQ